MIERKRFLVANELEDILSCDDEVLNDVYEWWVPPVRRLPPLLWVRIQTDLGPYLVERGLKGGTPVLSWYHRQFREAAEEVMHLVHKWLPLNLLAVITVTLAFCICKRALLNVKEDLRGLFGGLTIKCELERYLFSFRKYLIGKNGSSLSLRARCS